MHEVGAIKSLLDRDPDTIWNSMRFSTATSPVIVLIELEPQIKEIKLIVEQSPPGETRHEI